MTARFKIFIFILIPFLLGSQPANGQQVRRHVLALYDSKAGETPKENHVHMNAEVILNHLGCVVDYHDLQSGLPDDGSMQKYRGVLTWFYRNEMDAPVAYLRWATRQVQAGRRFVILGNIGAFMDRQTGKFLKIAKLNQFTNKLGFMIKTANWTEEPSLIELVYKDPEMVEFERTLDYEVTQYEHYSVTVPGSKVYLKLRRNDQPDSESDLVFTTSHGGFAAATYVVYENNRTFNKKWRLNPFRFFEEAFGLRGLPRPDVTTLNGMRIWTSHIDGDALISKSEVKQDAYCGEVIRDEILKKYRWPTSVSVVVGEIIRGQQFADIARSIYEIDWVEAASHSHAHPFYWAEDYAGKEKYASRHLPIPGYTFNVRTEVIGSVKYINETLLPSGKKVRTFFWTGNCEPTPAAIKLCQKLGIHNINGGDSIFDGKNPSYTSVAPLGVEVGGYRQIYAPNSNENIYTNEWHGPYYGFKFVLETFRNTESPVRIKPINIYYHYYSGERWAALNALKKVLDETIILEVAPMFISEYTAIVQGFYSAQMTKVDSHTWRLSNYGECRTVRFDRSDAFPDLAHCQNVLGFMHYQGSLYVHLGGAPQAVVALTDVEPKKIYLEQGSHKIANWTAGQGRISFEATGYGKGEFVIANLSQDADYKIAMHDGKTSGLVQKSDMNGRLRFLHPMSGTISIRISKLR